MARKIGFHTYSVRIHEQYKRTYETLSALRGEIDFLKLLYDDMKTIQDSQQNNESSEQLACLRKIDRHDRHLTGLIEAGHYGETANIVHSKSGKVVHRQATDEASLLPFFFRLVVPSGRDQGLLILQRDNRVQAKQMFRSIVIPILQKFDENFRCEIEPIMNRETFEKLVGGGEVQQIKFIRMSIPEDFADAYDKGRHETEGSMELVIKARRGRGLPMRKRLIDWMKSDASVRDQFRVPGLEFEYDTVKADLRIGKSKRTLDFGKRLSNPIIDLTDEVKFDGKSGHPTYSSLLEETAKLADDQMFGMFGD